jgi:hypothetical protein
MCTSRKRSAIGKRAHQFRTSRLCGRFSGFGLAAKKPTCAQFFTGLADIHTMMPTLALFSPAARTGLRGFVSSRFGRRTSTLPTLSSSRLTVSPPSLRLAPESWWQRAMLWLMVPAPGKVAQPLNRIPAVRTDFIATLADVSTEDADALRSRISQARSLRELWHLRADVFRVVGIAHSQSEAEQRVALLSRHFPARAPRSQFAPL